MLTFVSVLFGTISTESALSVDDEQDPLLYLGVKAAGSTWEHSISLLGVTRGAETPVIWQYELWSFQRGGTKLEIFLPKNQHTQRKLFNFENWVNGEVSKIGHHFSK